MIEVPVSMVDDIIEARGVSAVNAHRETPNAPTPSVSLGLDSSDGADCCYGR